MCTVFVPLKEILLLFVETFCSRLVNFHTKCTLNKNVNIPKTKDSVSSKCCWSKWITTHTKLNFDPCKFSYTQIHISPQLFPKKNSSLEVFD